MSFENELKQVFNIDIWQIKPQFSQEKHSALEDFSDIKTLKTVEKIDTILESKVNDNFLFTTELVYCNDMSSDRVINFFIDQSFNLNFLKNIIDKLFYKSKVNIYYGSSANSKLADESDALVINQDDFISQEHSLLSVENKKHILEKLYQYADFKTN
jgi:hypothetical protein